MAAFCITIILTFPIRLLVLKGRLIYQDSILPCEGEMSERQRGLLKLIFKLNLALFPASKKGMMNRIMISVLVVMGSVLITLLTLPYLIYFFSKGEIKKEGGK